MVFFIFLRFSLLKLIRRSSGINPSIKLDHSQLRLLPLELVTANGSTLTVAAPLTPFLL